MCHSRHHLELYWNLRRFGDLNPTHLQGEVTSVSTHSLRHEDKQIRFAKSQKYSPIIPTYANADDGENKEAWGKGKGKNLIP